MPVADDTQRDGGGNREGFLKFFGDHLVALGGTYVPLDGSGQEAGEERFFALPGFVLSLRGGWRLVTTGHAIKEIERKLQAGEYRMTHCVLAASFGSGSQGEEAIPFDCRSAVVQAIADQSVGLDYAVLTLNFNERAWLEENGIRPISHINWATQDPAKCEVFALLGFPHCAV